MGYRRYRGVRVGDETDRFGDKHHYVEFDVDIQAEHRYWFVVERPWWAFTDPQPWESSADNMRKRAGFRWLDPVSSWSKSLVNPEEFVIECRR
jgi:hypothetical protein